MILRPSEKCWPNSVIFIKFTVNNKVTFNTVISFYRATLC